MATHSDLAAKLLRDAAVFFRHIAEENPDLKADMLDNAEAYEQVADLVQTDPTGVLDLEEDAE